MKIATVKILRSSPRVRLWTICLALFLAVETLGRAILTGWAALDHPGYLPELLLGWPLGLLDDAATGVLLALPFLFGLYLFAPLFRRRALAWIPHVMLLVFLGVLVFIAASELVFWNEFNSRLNGIAVFYLLFPHEVIGNLRESFDLGLILPAIAMLTLLFYWLLRRPLSAAISAPTAPGERPRVLLFAGLLSAAALPAYAFGPIAFSDYREVNEVSKNGLHSFLKAALTNDSEYDGVYPGMPEADALATVRALVAQDNTRFLTPPGERSLLRHVDNGATPKPLNIVLVLEESFGMSYLDGRDADGGSVAPNLRRLAKDAVFFSNIYATGNRTVRGLEAILTSFPPIPGISTSRRPGSEGINSLPFLLKRFGYQTAFLYGGRALFDNMGYYWSTIGYDEVWDQADISDPGFSTIWGVADEYLFTEALKRLDDRTAGGKPQFITLLTVSNHRPYTYPDGRIDKPSSQKKRLNAATYADWAFADFIERARGHDWFDDTVFVFIGDHGARIYGAAQVPVPSYRVPLLIYAPKHIAPRLAPVVGSNMDFAPTLLGLLGFSYDSPFFGVDLLRVAAGGGRVVMEHNYSVAFGDGRDVAVLMPSAESKGYSMAPGPQDLEPVETPRPGVLGKAVALYQTAHRMFYARQYHGLSAGF